MVESWGTGDTIGLLQQLGFILMPGPKLMIRMIIGQGKSRLFGGRGPCRFLLPDRWQWVTTAAVLNLLFISSTPFLPESV